LRATSKATDNTTRPQNKSKKVQNLQMKKVSNDLEKWGNYQESGTYPAGWEKLKALCSGTLLLKPWGSTLKTGI